MALVELARPASPGCSVRSPWVPGVPRSRSAFRAPGSLESFVRSAFRALESLESSVLAPRDSGAMELPADGITG